MNNVNARQAAVMLILAGTVGLGCLDEPPIEERWTRLDLTEASVEPMDELGSGGATIDASTRVIYRDLITGGYVAEIRVSADLTLDDVRVGPDEQRLEMAFDVEDILANSVTAGRDVRMVTGWHHLIQEVTFEVPVEIPAQVPTAAGGMAAPQSAFLVLYMGDVDEIELEDGRDSLIVTPFALDEYEILMTGYELRLPGQTVRSGISR